ncbi:DUF6118 family protein [Caulobacter sp. RHG1]|jgi:hypothetical protein|uniref:DUF6118 family protein n=1 Tax=Caulobacter sp. (strain RHG1) TaxID=2545762 RepID=UPI001552EA0B|nr:DUF6118 family protein [Caulobacter sp. RHG1]NQE60784.1 hypothetical protein [Caulobacter sp. RHG1]
MEQDVGAGEPADAAVAFEALRREVALLNVAVAGLAAERSPAPDYSETLGEITKGVSGAVARLGKVMASPALAMSPVEMARQIAAAGDEARRQDWAAMQQAQEALQRAVRDLDGWIDRARLASVQNWRLMQAAAFGVVGGVVLYVSVSTIIVNAAPTRWAWPEKRAAHVLDRDMWSAGERLLSVADPERWRRLSSQAASPRKAEIAVDQSLAAKRSRLTQNRKR